MNRDFESTFSYSQPSGLWGRLGLKEFNLYAGFNTGIVAFAVGIFIYFAWPVEPDWRWILASCILSGSAYWALREKPNVWPSIIWLIFMVTLGLGRAVWHSAEAETPRLPQQERTYRIEGWVSAIEKSGNSERYVIETLAVRGLTDAEMPKRLRVRVTKHPEPPIEVGMTMNWLVAAKAPPGPVVPGGYDSGQAAYFKGIGGFGFGYGAPEAQSAADLGLWDSTHRAVVRWRYSIADRVMETAPPETAGLQAALMTGVRRYIPAEQTENLRVAGLAHILAISGLHMALLAGGHIQS